MLSWALSDELAAVPDWTPLFEVCVLHAGVGDPFHVLSTYPVVDESAVLISVEFIPDDAPPVALVEVLPVDVPCVLPASHPEEAFVKVIVADEHEDALA